MATIMNLFIEPMAQQELIGNQVWKSNLQIWQHSWVIQCWCLRVSVISLNMNHGDSLPCSFGITGSEHPNKLQSGLGVQ